MPNPKLVSVAPEGSPVVAVDDEGRVWHGEIRYDSDGKRYVEWQHVRSEFPR